LPEKEVSVVQPPAGILLGPPGQNSSLVTARVYTYTPRVYSTLQYSTSPSLPPADEYIGHPRQPSPNRPSPFSAIDHAQPRHAGPAPLEELILGVGDSGRRSRAPDQGSQASASLPPTHPAPTHLPNHPTVPLPGCHPPMRPTHPCDPPAHATHRARGRRRGRWQRGRRRGRGCGSVRGGAGGGGEASAAAARAARSTASAPSAAVSQVAAARAVAARVAVGKVVARGDSGWQGGVDSGDGGDDDGGGGGGGGSEGGDVPLNLRAGMGQSQPRWSQAGSAMRGLCESGYSSSECAL
jgi:hypothetical protein